VIDWAEDRGTQSSETPRTVRKAAATLRLRVAQLKFDVYVMPRDAATHTPLQVYVNPFATLPYDNPILAEFQIWNIIPFSNREYTQNN
jgi:hypothetical protein